MGNRSVSRKLNAWTLGGLIVGPILGSGIILLPPLAYVRLGPQAIWAWLIILAVGGAFSAVFIRMTLLTQSDSGIASLVAQERGAVWGALASNFLTGAVIFGVVPVLLTAAQLWPAAWSFDWPPVFWAALFLVVALAFLLAGLTTVSGLTLVLSSLTAVLLTLGSALALFEAPEIKWPLPNPWTPGFGQALLLLFWAIVGWEVVANYSKQVRDPERTVPRAGIVSLAVVSLVYLVVSLALQTRAPSTSLPPDVALVLTPLLGKWAGSAAGLLATGLCLSTLLMFTGAVTRMTAQRARDGELPRWLGRGRVSEPPRIPIGVLGLTSAALLIAVGRGWVNLAFLVGIANLFFLGNALLGLTAAWTILGRRGWRPILVVLGAVFVALLTQGSVLGWILVAAVVVATVFFRR